MSRLLRWIGDEGLVQRSLRGNQAAFGVLVERHLPMAHALAWGHTGSAIDADDIVQEAFLRAYTKLDTLREANKFAGWLAGIVRNLAHDLRTRNQRVEFVGADALEHLPAPSRALEEEEVYALLRESVLAMDEPAREVLTLHYFAQKPVKEIAQLQGISTEAAFKRLQRAREALGKHLLGRLEASPRRNPQVAARKKAILSGIASSAVAWKAAAATGGSGSVLVVVAVLLFLSGIGIVGYRFSQQDSGANVASSALPPSSPTAVAAALEAPAAATEAVPPAEPLFRIHGRVMDLDGNVVSGASVRIERGDWATDALPPSDVFTAMSTADANGDFAFESLAEGRYSIAAFKGTAIDVGVANPGTVAPDWEEVLVLKPGLPLEGHVVDGAGRGIAGAQVEPFGYGPLGEIGERELSSAVRAASGPDGAFRIGLLWPGEWTLIARADGYAPALSDAVQAGAHDARIVLLVSGGIQGTLTNSSTNLPMSNVKLRSTALGFLGTVRDVETDDAGGFLFENLAPGPFRVSVESPGVVLLEPPLSIMVEPAQVTMLNLSAGGGGTISGRVIDSETREGIPEMEISLRGGELGTFRSTDAHWEQKSDVTGGYFFMGIPAGTYHIHVDEANGYLQDSSWNNPPIDIAGSREVEIDYAMKRGVLIAGTVVDAQGKLLEGATVHAELLDAEQDEIRHWSGTSKADGRFLIALHRGAKDIRISASKDAAYATPMTGLSTGSEGLNDIVLRLDQTANGAATVRVDMRGYEQAVSRNELRVSVQPEIWSSAGRREAKVSVDGVVSFNGMIPGRYQASLWNEAEQRIACDGPQFEVVDGQETAVLIACENVHPDVSGTVLDVAGRPISGASLVVIPGGGNSRVDQIEKTDASGQFTLKQLPYETFRVSATADGYFEDSMVVGAEDTVADITLWSVRTIRGRVHDAQTGAPMQTIEVYQVPEEMAPTTAFDAINYTTNTYQLKRVGNSDGTFSIAVSPERTMAIIVRCAGYLPEFQIVPDDSNDVLDFKMHEGLRLSGIVRDPQGQPLSGVTVSLEIQTIGWEPKQSGRTTTDIAGAYSLAGLVPGVTLRFTHPDFGITERTVPANGILDVTLEGTGTLVVNLARVYGGAEPAQISVGVELPSGQRTAIEDRNLGEQTSFRWERLPKGLARVLVRIKLPQVDPMRLNFEEIASGEAEIRPGQTTELLLDFQTSGSGAGQVVDEAEAR